MELRSPSPTCIRFGFLRHVLPNGGKGVGFLSSSASTIRSGISLATPHQRTLKRILINACIIGFLEGMMSQSSIAYQTQHILDKYFDSKSDGDKCRLFLSLLKSRSMIVVRRNITIKMINTF